MRIVAERAPLIKEDERTIEETRERFHRWLQHINRFDVKQIDHRTAMFRRAFCELFGIKETELLDAETDYVVARAMGGSDTTLADRFLSMLTVAPQAMKDRIKQQLDQWEDEVKQANGASQEGLEDDPFYDHFAEKLKDLGYDLVDPKYADVKRELIRYIENDEQDWAPAQKRLVALAKRIDAKSPPSDSPKRPKKRKSIRLPGPPIKWTGSKRRAAPEIIESFPREIKTYFEPLLGGGSVLLSLFDSEVKVEKFRCSDINAPLIGIWHLIKDDPDDLIESYVERWESLQREESDFYYSTRSAFNDDHDPRKLFFLLRTCRNGILRYNKSGEFNSAFHHKRDGIRPEKLRLDLEHWSKKLNTHDVEFEVKEYSSIETSEGDFVYLDPPYELAQVEYYGGGFDYSAFWHWIEELPCGFALSFDGEVPSHLYKECTDIMGEKLCISTKGTADQQSSEAEASPIKEVKPTTLKELMAKRKKS